MRVFLTILFTLMSLIFYLCHRTVWKESFWDAVKQNIPNIDNNTRNTVSNTYLVCAFIFLILSGLICFSII